MNPGVMLLKNQSKLLFWLVGIWSKPQAKKNGRPVSLP
jgi:hypothetical protein